MIITTDVTTLVHLPLAYQVKSPQPIFYMWNIF